jgi:hypothetical protein
MLQHSKVARTSDDDKAPYIVSDDDKAPYIVSVMDKKLSMALRSIQVYQDTSEYTVACYITVAELRRYNMLCRCHLKR